MATKGVITIILNVLGYIFLMCLFFGWIGGSSEIKNKNRFP
jgi:TM2 domain-containing membrane protein YozV